MAAVRKNHSDKLLLEEVVSIPTIYKATNTNQILGYETVVNTMI